MKEDLPALIRKQVHVISIKQKTTADQELTSIESMYQEQAEFITVITNEFNHAKTLCFRKTQEWDTYSSLYMDEMEALSETIDILCSDESRRTFGVAINPDFKTRSDIVSFLDTLRKATRSAHSLWLANIAARIQETYSMLCFTDDMMQMLEDEQVDDLAKRYD